MQDRLQFLKHKDREYFLVDLTSADKKEILQPY